jgi:hypothetical protein
MPDNSENLTPQQRIALTRQALMRHMVGNKNADAYANASADTSSAAEQARESMHKDDFNADGDDTMPNDGGLGRLWHNVVHAAASWWRSHPAHMVVEVAEPVLGRMARKSPMKLLGAAAAVGAIVVFARPWRLISMTGLAVAALKSTQVSSLVSSFMEPASHGKRKHDSY